MHVLYYIKATANNHLLQLKTLANFALDAATIAYSNNMGGAS